MRALEVIQAVLTVHIGKGPFAVGEEGTVSEGQRQSRRVARTAGGSAAAAAVATQARSRLRA